jgi:hypothetical protein
MTTSSAAPGPPTGVQLAGVCHEPLPPFQVVVPAAQVAWVALTTEAEPNSTNSSSADRTAATAVSWRTYINSKPVPTG